VIRSLHRSLFTFVLFAAGAAACARLPAVDRVDEGAYSLSHSPPPGKVDRNLRRIEARMRGPEGETPGEGVQLQLHIRQGDRPDRVKAMRLERVEGTEQIWSAAIPRYGRGAEVNYYFIANLPGGTRMRLPSGPAGSTYRYLATVAAPAGLVDTRWGILGMSILLFLCASLLALYAGLAGHPVARSRALDWAALACTTGTAGFFVGAFPLSWLHEHVTAGRSGIELSRGLADPTVRAVVVFLYWVIVVSHVRGRIFGIPHTDEPRPRSLALAFAAGTASAPLWAALAVIS
jgi:hypothetical protein